MFFSANSSAKFKARLDNAILQDNELKNYVSNLEERYDSSLPTFRNPEEDKRLFNDLEEFLKDARTGDEENE